MSSVLTMISCESYKFFFLGVSYPCIFIFLETFSEATATFATSRRQVNCFVCSALCALGSRLVIRFFKSFSYISHVHHCLWILENQRILSVLFLLSVTGIISIKHRICLKNKHEHFHVNPNIFYYQDVNTTLCSTNFQIDKSCHLKCFLVPLFTFLIIADHYGIVMQMDGKGWRLLLADPIFDFTK